MRRSRSYRAGLAVAATILLFTRPARADVKLPAIIGSHMVLESGMPLTIWGWADAGEDVVVSIAEIKASAKADENGDWLVKLPPIPATSDPLEMTVSGKNTIKLTDVLVGEVWLGSGQSNMQWSVSASNNPAEEIAAADNPQIRLFLVPLVAAGKPAKDVDASWTVCSPQTVAPFSAVCYYFGRELHKALNVPVGMVASSWGGTRIEPWIPPVGYDEVPELAGELQQIESQRAGYQAGLKSKLAEMKAWLEAAQKAADAGQPIPDAPAIPANPFNSSGGFTGLYNGMIHPLAPFTIRGALWYQGEANVGQGMHYRDLMRGLIRGWRSVWGQGDFPFLFVQLAPYRYGGHPQALPELWEAQAATLNVPNVGMAVTTDISDINDIHPRNKQEVGRRLALWALARFYSQNELVYSGPLYESMTVEGGRIRVKFRHAAGGLAVRGDKPLSWFSIAAADKKFVPAQATIDGETVVVEAAEVGTPVAVRFGWHQTAEPNLMNKSGLPASPFRTDDWSDAVSAPPPQ
ncbi:MAG TPA: sialate O-acetylesterase [Pirellulales bacterium]|nr:sialate O-acetylesterase [Pirellulales bacterium]